MCLLRFRRIEKNSVRIIDHTEHCQCCIGKVIACDSYRRMPLNLLQISGHSKIKRDINESNFCHKICILDNYSFCMKMNRYCILDLAIGYLSYEKHKWRHPNESFTEYFMNSYALQIINCIDFGVKWNFKFPQNSGVFSVFTCYLRVISILQHFSHFISKILIWAMIWRMYPQKKLWIIASRYRLFKSFA